MGVYYKRKNAAERRLKREKTHMPAQPTANQTLLFEQCVFELLQSSKVRKMDEYIQHGTTTTLTHSLAVAWYSYRLYLFWAFAAKKSS